MEDLKIVLLGYMGSGKTTIGRIVANHLSVKFLDLDDYIAQKENLSVAEIFKEKGEVYFRKKEHDYLKEIFLNENRFLLSLGGGTPCFGNNMELINQQTQYSFYIQTSLDELVKRLKKEKASRPMIAHLDDGELQEFIGKHLFERSFFYNQAHRLVKSGERTPTEIAESIVNALV